MQATTIDPTPDTSSVGDTSSDKQTFRAAFTKHIGLFSRSSLLHLLEDNTQPDWVKELVFAELFSRGLVLTSIDATSTVTSDYQGSEETASTTCTEGAICT